MHAQGSGKSVDTPWAQSRPPAECHVSILNCILASNVAEEKMYLNVSVCFIKDETVIMTWESIGISFKRLGFHKVLSQRGSCFPDCVKEVPIDGGEHRGVCGSPVHHTWLSFRGTVLRGHTECRLVSWMHSPGEFLCEEWSLGTWDIQVMAEFLFPYPAPSTVHLPPTPTPSHLDLPNLPLFRQMPPDPLGGTGCTARSLANICLC